MFKRVLSLLIAVLVLTGISAYAQGLPAVSDEKGQAAAFTAAETAQTVPAVGDWNRTTEAISEADAALLDSVRTQIAIKATELNFNSYAYMTYAEKASVVVKYTNYSCAEDSYTFYGEGDAKANNSVIPAYAALSGDFAVFSLKDGAWTNVGMFSLTNDANADNPYFLVDLSCYELGDAPAYLGWYDSAADLWHVVGVNQAYVDTLIAQVF